jgi:SNF2 family DNA or RNA helicase
MAQNNIIRPLWKNFEYFTHQLDGIQWMLQKERDGTSVPNKDFSHYTTVYGGLQCDDMGLGKTIQIISTILNNPLKSTLLLAPLAMIETWASISEKVGFLVYQVDNREWVCTNSPNSPFPTYFKSIRPRIYITNYEKLYHNFSLFKIPFNRLVFDEAHKIRNPDGQIAIYARKIQASIRWAVTGTPLVNSYKDVVSLLSFIGVPCSVLWRWEKRFEMILPSLLIHRSLSCLRSIIPNAPPIPIIHTFDLDFTSKEEEKFYFGVQDSSSNAFKADILSSQETFKLLLRLRQISVHPQVYINAKRRENSSYKRHNWLEPSTKLEAIQSIILNDDTTSIHKYIVFCQFTDEMDLIRDFLVYQEFVSAENCLMYHGSLTQKERTDVLTYSKETTETTVLLLQLQAGGVGLNLQEYDRIIFVSPWWTSSLMDQAIARAVRMGQTKQVIIYHLRLAAEKESTINIDLLVQLKADEKRKMLNKLFYICAKDNKLNHSPPLEEEEEETEDNENETKK